MALPGGSRYFQSLAGAASRLWRVGAMNVTEKVFAVLPEAWMTVQARCPVAGTLGSTTYVAR